MFEGAQPYLHPSYPLHQPSLRVADINVLHYQICPDIWTGVLQVGVNLSGHLDGLWPHICPDSWTAVTPIIRGPTIRFFKFSTGSESDVLLQFIFRRRHMQLYMQRGLSPS